MFNNIFRTIIIASMIFLSFAGWSQDPAVVFQSNIYLHDFDPAAGIVTFNKNVSPFQNNYNLVTPFSLNNDLCKDNPCKQGQSVSFRQIAGLVHRYTVFENQNVRFRIAPMKLKLRFTLADRTSNRKKRLLQYLSM